MILEIGDWVRSYSQGIWQIYRILDYTCIDPVSRKEKNKRTVFSKRFVSNSFKRSFKEECCDPAIVMILNTGELKELQEFIDNNADLYNKFEGYEPKDIDCVYNARIGIPEDQSALEIANLLENSSLLKEAEINTQLIELGFISNTKPSWTVQYVAKDFQCIDGYLAFKYDRVLE
jgi:hypothetical protein